MEKVNLSAALARVEGHYQSRLVGQLNGQAVKVVKAKGPFPWHHHADVDELFLVVRGRLRLEFRDRVVTLEPGEFMIVPRGVEHRPNPEEEAEVVLFEPLGTRNTGEMEDSGFTTATDVPL